LRRPERRRLTKDIFLVRFDSQYELAATFLRIQEHYESRRFRHRVFTLEQYMDWYAATFGAFTYYEDWTGFNVPSAALMPFYQGTFDPLLEKEKRFLQLFKDEPAPFYVIGIASNDDVTHEIAHALFSMRPRYRRAIREAMRRYDTTAISRTLADRGYHPRVLEDEVHAYLVDPGTPPGGLPKRLRPLRRTLRRIFHDHAQLNGIPNRDAM
jgi:hypothetical protein